MPHQNSCPVQRIQSYLAIRSFASIQACGATISKEQKARKMLTSITKTTGGFEFAGEYYAARCTFLSGTDPSMPSKALIQPNKLNIDRLLQVTGGCFDPSKTLHRLRIAIEAGRARAVPPARRDRPPRPPLAEGARRAAHVWTADCAEQLDPELEAEREPAGRARAVTPARRDRPPRPALTEGVRRAADLTRLRLSPTSTLRLLASRVACHTCVARRAPPAGAGGGGRSRRAGATARARPAGSRSGSSSGSSGSRSGAGQATQAFAQAV